MTYLHLNNIECYKKSFTLSNYVWNIVIEWKMFAQKTLGEQFVRAVDSISANIAEGFGRYGKRDKVKFYRIALGSIKEALDWNEKAKVRNLITEEQHLFILNKLISLPQKIYYLIKFTNQKLTI